MKRFSNYNDRSGSAPKNPRLGPGGGGGDPPGDPNGNDGNYGNSNGHDVVMAPVVNGNSNVRACNICLWPVNSPRCYHAVN